MLFVRPGVMATTSYQTWDSDYLTGTYADDNPRGGGNSATIRGNLCSQFNLVTKTEHEQNCRVARNFFGSGASCQRNLSFAIRHEMKSEGIPQNSLR